MPSPTNGSPYIKWYFGFVFVWLEESEKQCLSLSLVSATTRHIGPKFMKNKTQLSLRNEWDWILSYQGSLERCWALVCGWTQILLESWPPLHNLRHTESKEREKDKRGLFTGGPEGVEGSHTWVAFSSVGRRWTKQRLRIAATFLGSRPQLPCLALC